MASADPRLVELVGRLIAEAPAGRPPLIAVAGAQGSGKTTLAREAAERFGAAQLSLDDVYLTRAERQALARGVHPLFETRGPPGTHDLALLSRALDALAEAGEDTVTPLPTFDKRADDRLPPAEWRTFKGRSSAILLDGWCLGALPEDDAALAPPINALERDQDPNGAWRRAINARVAGDYAALADRCDALIFLKAPAFDVVLDWRCEQEAELLGLAPGDLPSTERARIAGFIAHFERLTRRMIAGGVEATVTVTLDRDRVPGSIAA